MKVLYVLRIVNAYG